MAVMAQMWVRVARIGSLRFTLSTRKAVGRRKHYRNSVWRKSGNLFFGVNFEGSIGVDWDLLLLGFWRRHWSLLRSVLRVEGRSEIEIDHTSVIVKLCLYRRLVLISTVWHYL
jgi:hypothetical protein